MNTKKEASAQFDRAIRRAAGRESTVSSDETPAQASGSLRELVARDAGLPDSMAERLEGESFDELRADAGKLKFLLGGATEEQVREAGSFGGGARGRSAIPEEEPSMDSVIRGEVRSRRGR